MANSCTVSILVPIYNVERYLRECLDSLISQTLEDIEIICIDDGSTDGSLDIVKEFQERDSRVTYITKPNSGYGNSMNMGLDKACGKYVGIVESDDLAEPDMFEKLVALSEEHELDVVKSNFFTHISHTDPDFDPVVNNLEFCKKNVVFDPLQDQEIFLTQPAIWSALYNREFLLKSGIRFLETPGASFQDTSFNYRVFALAKRVYVTPEAFLHYRVDNVNSSVKSQDKIFCICDEYAEMWDFTSARPEVFELLGKRLPQIQFGGYRWNLERLTPGLQPLFYERFVAAFQKMQEAGLLDRSYFGDQVWSYIQGMLQDPDEFFYRTYGPKDVQTTYVVRLPELSKDALQKVIKPLLRNVGKQDEIIVADSFNGKDVLPVFAEFSRIDSRLFSDIDLWKCAPSQEIDLGRIRGSKLVAISCQGKPSGLPSRSAIKFLKDLRQEFVYLNKGKSDLWMARYETADLGGAAAKELPMLFSLVAHGVLQLDAGASSQQLESAANVADRFQGLDHAFERRVACAQKVSLGQYQEALGLFEGCLSLVLGEEIHAEASASCIESNPALLQWYRGLILPFWNLIRSLYQALSYDDRLRIGERPLSTDYPALVIARDKRARVSGGSTAMELGSDETQDPVEQPDVSVIIPVFNAQEYLLECLESVLCQSGVDIQVICIDDGSSDESVRILQEMAQSDDRMSVLVEMNGGAGLARNRGIEQACGKYLAFIDPDDYYPSNSTLFDLFNKAVKKKAKMCGGTFISFDPAGEVREKYYGDEAAYTIKEEGFRTIKQDQFDYGWIRFIYDQALFSEQGLRFPPYRWYEDPVFFVNAVSLARRYYVIPQPTYTYREDYKKPSWSHEKIRDMLAGISHNLAFAKRRKYGLLYSRLIHRVDYDYRDAIVDALEDKEVFLRLVEMQTELDLSLVNYVKEEGFEAYVLAPFFYRVVEERRTAVGRIAHRIEKSPMYKNLQERYEQYRRR